MGSAEDILQLVQQEIRQGLHDSFPMLSKTTPGNPVPLFDAQQMQRYWLIPFLLSDRVRGLAILDLTGRLVSHGVLTPNVTDEIQLMTKTFFEAVPSKALEEIRQEYGGFRFTPPFLSYDDTPRRWAWLLRLEKETAEQRSIFIGPQGWYEKRDPSEREG